MGLPSATLIGGPSSANPTIEIPGLSGSPDILPATTQFSDEFDQDFNGIASPWLSMQSPTHVDTSAGLSMLHILNTTSNSNVCRGVYAPLPGGLTYPLTITLKLTEADAGNGGLVGVFVSPVAPGSAGTGYGVFVQGEGGGSGNQTAVVNMATGGLTGGGAAPSPPSCPMWLRLVMSDSTHVQPQISAGGYVYGNGTAEVLAAAAAYIGIFNNSLNNTTGEVDMFCDYLRII